AADTVLMPSPLTHISGIVHALLVPTVFGANAVLMDRWEPAAARALLAAERVTYMVGAPTFLRDLATGAPGETTSLRLFSCGGADVDPALVRQAAARLGCVAKRVYGSTEFPTVTTTGPDDPPERRIDSEGRAIGANEGLLAAHPAGAEVAVVRVPDPVAGEIACAVLRLRPGARPPTLAEVAEHLTARGLSRRKLPERLEVVADFPRTASGKIVKRALRE